MMMMMIEPNWNWGNFYTRKIVVNDSIDQKNAKQAQNHNNSIRNKKMDGLVRIN